MVTILSSGQTDEPGAFRQMPYQKLPFKYSTHYYNNKPYIDVRRDDGDPGYFRFCLSYLGPVLQLMTRRLIFGGWSQMDAKSTLLELEEEIYLDLKKKTGVTTIITDSTMIAQPRCIIEERVYLGEKYLLFTKYNTKYFLPVRFDEAGNFMLLLTAVYHQELGADGFIYTSILDCLAQFEHGKYEFDTFSDTRDSLKEELLTYKQNTGFEDRYGLRMRRQLRTWNNIIFPTCSNCFDEANHG